MQYLLLLLCLGGVQLVPLEESYLSSKEKCGYESCPATSPNMLNVHIVPHTHDDVGWLKTVDQYYYGSRNNIQKAGVQYILDSVVKELWESPERRFIYVETAFFWKWWVRQPTVIQEKVHTLVRQGRLQMVGGAWSMNDEAASHYQSTIDQFTWGLKKLNDTFGKCGWPHVGWQIDPFGHSREFANLLAMMGYDGLFLGRIDYQDKRARLKGKNMEMVWRGDDVLGKSSDIFTGVLFNTYSPPPGFCFDVLCADEPIIDDPSSPMYNVELKTSLFKIFFSLLKIMHFLDICTNMSKAYKTSNILLTMGEDFHYQDAAMWFRNLDKLIEYSNLKAAKDGMNISVFYSTPNCYLKSVKEANPTLPTKRDDFFPYARVMQHHDAITGTEKQHVTHDYERLLSQAIDDAIIIAKQAFNKMVTKDRNSKPVFDFQRCHLNESSCEVSESSDSFVVTIYNPLGWSVKEPVRIPVTDGASIKTQLVSISTKVKSIPTRVSRATQEIVFLAELKPLSYKNFYIKKSNRPKRNLKPTFDFYSNINRNVWPNINYNDLSKTEYEKYLTTQPIPDAPLYLQDIPNAYDRIINLDVLKNGPNDNSEKILEMEKILTENGRKMDKINIENHFETDPNAQDKKILELKQILNDNTRKTDKGNDAANIDDLKANTDDHDQKMMELEKIFDDRKSTAKGTNEPKMANFPVMFNMEEMRMLSDDPHAAVGVDDVVSLGNQHFTLEVNKATGVINNVIFSDHSKANFSINMYYYLGTCGDNHDTAHRASGAYIFRPACNAPIKLDSFSNEIIKGDIVKEIRVELSPAGYIDVKIYDNHNYIEVEWVVGPIPILDDIGKEYIVKYETKIVNNGEFHTDSNGRQLLKRNRDFRPQWNVTLQEPVPGNYYPVTNQINIKNNDLKLTVLTDRSQGGSSMADGEIELMLHRRLLCDDAFGVGEALNETAKDKGLVARGKHRVYITKGKDDLKAQVVEMHQPPILLFADAKNIKYDDWLAMDNEFSWLDKDLPKGIHLLTLEPWDSKLLIRVENYYEDENASANVNLQDLFKNIKILNVEEMLLAGHRPADGYKQWVWKKEGVTETAEAVKSPDSKNLTVNIKGKEIKTFLADFEIKQHHTLVKSPKMEISTHYEVTTVV
ncbi:hypothetical protein HW555_005649 [Spodoptera exigua]|uniref:alpha-mannosidase n=1 Tax=Spodoptera exigua TaxID=7107 RepID=A0A835L792_SPOEX|nr:hypothetical protein HW555_005649 [Spodoptera exigua]